MDISSQTYITRGFCYLFLAEHWPWLLDLNKQVCDWYFSLSHFSAAENNIQLIKCRIPAHLLSRWDLCFLSRFSVTLKNIISCVNSREEKSVEPEITAFSSLLFRTVCSEAATWERWVGHRDQKEHAIDSVLLYTYSHGIIPSFNFSFIIFS